MQAKYEFVQIGRIEGLEKAKSLGLEGYRIIHVYDGPSAPDGSGGGSTYHYAWAVMEKLILDAEDVYERLKLDAG